MIKKIVAEFVVALGFLVVGSNPVEVQDPVRCAPFVMNPGRLMHCVDR